jgi:hypothetical protein
MPARQRAWCDQCNAEIRRWGGYIYVPPPPRPDPVMDAFKRDVLAAGGSYSVIRRVKMLLCPAYATRVRSGSKLSALWWWLWERD